MLNYSKLHVQNDGHSSTHTNKSSSILSSYSSANQLSNDKPIGRRGLPSTGINQLLSATSHSQPSAPSYILSNPASCTSSTRRYNNSRMFHIGLLGFAWTLLFIGCNPSSIISNNMVMATPTQSAASSSPSSSSASSNNNDFPMVDSGDESAGSSSSSSSSSNMPSYYAFYSSSSPSLLDRISGEQFVQLFDRLMDGGELSRIIEQITARNNKLESIPANRISARQYINLLDNYSAGAVWDHIQPYMQLIIRQSNQRPRRSSFDSMSGYSIGYSKRNLDPMTGLSFGGPAKRFINFDEIDRSGFSGFAKRRLSSDFDEIDHSGFAGFAKRAANGRGLNFDEMDHSGFSGFAKRYSDFDEIDRAGFTGFAKRSANFDEIDRAGFHGFFKRRAPELAFDEIDRAGFSGFAKRSNFDEMDHSGFSGFGGYGGYGGNYGKRFIQNPVLNMMSQAKLKAISQALKDRQQHSQLVNNNNNDNKQMSSKS